MSAYVLLFHYEVLLPQQCSKLVLQCCRTEVGWMMVTLTDLWVCLQGEVDVEKGGPRRSHKHDKHVGEMSLPMRNGVMSKAGSESLVGRLESCCTTASFICSELRCQIWSVWARMTRLTGVEDLPCFSFCKSSCKGEKSNCFYKDYCWNTFLASQSLLYLF